MSGQLTDIEKLDSAAIEELNEAQAKFVIKALEASGHVRPWAINKAIEIAKTLVRYEL